MLRAAFLSCLLVLGALGTTAHADETTSVAPSTADVDDAAAAGEVPANDTSDGDCPYKGKGPCCAGCQEGAKTPAKEGTAEAGKDDCPCKQRARLRRQGS